MFKIHKGDKVKVMLGKDAGKEATVDRVDNKKSKVFLAGINVYKRHINARRFGQERGGVIELAKPLNLSNVMLVCPNCSKPTRVGISIQGDTSVRVCRKCKKELIMKGKV